MSRRGLRTVDLDVVVERGKGREGLIAEIGYTLDVSGTRFPPGAYHLSIVGPGAKGPSSEVRPDFRDEAVTVSSGQTVTAIPWSIGSGMRSTACPTGRTRR